MEDSIDPQLERLKRRAERERKARQEAERLLEDKSRALFESNIALESLNRTLEQKIQERTKELDAARRAAMDLAQRDQLTGLANRRCFLNYLQVILKDGPEASTVILFLINLDRFKGINDTYGHATGDTMLKTVGIRLQMIARDYHGALAARIGGDEFALAYCCNPGDEKTIAPTIADHIIHMIRTPITTDAAVLYPTCSVGFAMAPEHAETPDQLQHYADTAVFESKSLGRNQWCQFTADMIERVNERLTILRGLRAPDLEHELEVWYQPQHCLKTGRAEGVEALVRWRKGGDRPITPDKFIPLAEEQGIVSIITEAVLMRALREAGPWLTSGLIDRVSVNISPHDMRERQFSTMVLSSLQLTGLPGSFLEIEVTETAMMGNIEEVRRELDLISGRGVRFALDDFGTGYSNLAYLCSLPFNCLKIDKCFVDDILSNDSTRAVVNAIVTLARSLGLRTVVEGVETEAQRDYLRTIGCDIMQGYLASRPLPPEACFDYLTKVSVTQE